MMQNTPARILYCVLNWGLGHASRSIPVIRTLLDEGYTVTLASDGGPLELLRRTFPSLEYHALPSYNIHYPSRHVLINALSQLHKMLLAVRAEHKVINRLMAEYGYDLMISDNRYGCYHPAVPSVLITHQLRNLTRTAAMSKPGELLVDNYLRKFDQIWVPDTPDHALSGKMTDYASPKVRFVGYLSDVPFAPSPRRYQVAAILSGPEPQRTLLENEIRPQLPLLHGSTVLVRGVVEDAAPVMEGNLTIYPYMERKGIAMLLNSAEVIVCRTGYSSLMDLMKVGAKAILIPTPGQPEQIYLGEQLQGHQQFVVQHQGRVSIAEGVKELRTRDTVHRTPTDNSLLSNALGAIPGLIEQYQSR